MSAGRDVVVALGGRWHARRGMCRCPAHDDSTPSLHVTEVPGGTVLVHCFAGCEQAAVIGALKALELWPDSNGHAPRVRPARATGLAPALSEDDRQRSSAAREIWNRSHPPDGTAVETYLQARAIALPIPGALRYGILRHTPSGLVLPAVVAAIVDGQGFLRAIQRIFLRPNGLAKADVADAKMTLGPMLDGAVRLAPAGRVLGIAEGIETALSAIELFRLPVWACLGCHRMGALAIPDGVERLALFADQGQAGLRAAEKAARLYEHRGFEVSIDAPDGFKDFNDQARERRGGRHERHAISQATDPAVHADHAGEMAGAGS